MRTFFEFVEAIILEKDDAESFIDNHDLNTFFKFKNEVYGCTEESRVVLARMKNPSEDNTAEWRKEASFSAINFKTEVNKVFTHKELKSVKIIPKEEAVKGFKTKSGDGDIEIRLAKDDDIPANMDNIEEK